MPHRRAAPEGFPFPTQTFQIHCHFPYRRSGGKDGLGQATVELSLGERGEKAPPQENGKHPVMFEKGEGVGHRHEHGLKEGIDAQAYVPAFHHIVRHGFPFSTFKTTKPFVQKIARIAVVRNLGHGPIQRGTRRHIPAVWRTLLHENGRDVVQRQGSHHLIEGPVRAILPMRARHEVPGAAVTETRQAKREILSDHTRGKIIQWRCSTPSHCTKSGHLS